MEVFLEIWVVFMEVRVLLIKGSLPFMEVKVVFIKGNVVHNEC